VREAAGDHIDIERNDDDRDWHDHERLRAGNGRRRVPRTTST
jgi:hypothetical protein